MLEAGHASLLVLIKDLGRTCTCTRIVLSIILYSENNVADLCLCFSTCKKQVFS